MNTVSWTRAPAWASKYITERHDGRPVAFWSSQDELTKQETLLQFEPPRHERIVIPRSKP